MLHPNILKKGSRISRTFCSLLICIFSAGTFLFTNAQELKFDENYEVENQFSLNNSLQEFPLLAYSSVDRLSGDFGMDNINNEDGTNSSSPVGPIPTVIAYAIQPSCAAGVPGSDGYLQLSLATDGTHYNYSVGNTYTGPTDIASAIAFDPSTDLPLMFSTGLSNPSGSQDYTVRVFNAVFDCFTDVVMTMNEQDCISGCNCNEYLYLNEPTTNGAIHKFLLNGDQTMTEIGSPWYDNTAAGEDIDRPHGLAVDRNGLVYVGETPAAGGDIRRFDCAGNLSPETGVDGFSIPHRPVNMGSIGNSLYANTWSIALADNQISKYDICGGNPQTLLGKVEYCNNTTTASNIDNDWGFYIDPRTEIMYSTTDFGTGTTRGNYLYVFDDSDFDLDPNTCITGTTLTNLPEFGASVAGITTDAAGNLYIVVRNDTNLPNDPDYILKYGPGPAYPYLGTSALDIADDGTGWNWAIGIVYSEIQDLLYVSTGAVLDDCIAIFDTDLNYVNQGVPAPGNGDQGKGIALSRECCPLNNNIVIDTTLCFASVSDSLFLHELIDCGGIICEGTWEEAAVNTDVTFDFCSNSVKVNSLDACGSFTLSSDGVGPNAQCGAFVIQVNIEVAVVGPPTFTFTPPSCANNNDPPAITFTTTTQSNGVTYQWQESTTDCNTGFTDITGATTASYDPPTLSQETYYRVLSTGVGSCFGGNCFEVSDCVTMTPVPVGCGGISVQKN